MDVLAYLVPIAICMGILGVIAFFWTLKNKQYDDLDGSANRILFEEDLEEENNEINKSKKNKEIKRGA